MPSTIDSRDQRKQETYDLFKSLRQLKNACGRNKHDQIIVLIMALLDAGIDTRPRLVGALKQLGFNQPHAVLAIKEGIRETRWRCDSDDRYHALTGAQ